MASAPATTSSSCARRVLRATCRWWRRAARVRPNTFARCSTSPTRTVHSPPAFFIPAPSPFPDSSIGCANRASWYEHEGTRMNHDDLQRVDFRKGGGLVPAIVQDASSGEALMLGYMNAEALAATRASGFVTFWSRSKQRLWKKGETSGNVLAVKSIQADCDGDTLLIQAESHGPTCHLGTSSCFGEDAKPPLAFLAELDALVAQRNAERPAGSYTTELFEAGIRRIAQKIGEEEIG